MTRSDLVAAAESLVLRAQGDGWAGPDPYDGLWGDRWPRALVSTRRGRQVVVQLHARAPFNIRRLYRRRDPVLAKSLATFGLAATRLHRCTGSEKMRDTAMEALGRLCEDRSAGGEAWGYPFPVQTRWSYYAAGVPNVVVTSFAIAALTEAAAWFQCDNFAHRARSAAEWVLDSLFDARQGIFVYHPDSDALIHNASLLGARAVRHGGVDAKMADRAIERAIENTLQDQRPDGSWPYGRGSGLSFVDSFHTGYVLDCLATLRGTSPETEPALAAGARFYADRFFGPRGEARLWPDRRFPEDAHAAGTGLSTLAVLADLGFLDRNAGAAAADRVLMTTRGGRRSIHRRYRWGTTHVHYPRWCDAHLALGLASYAQLV